MSWSAIILLFQALSWCEIHSLLVLVLTVLIMMVKHHTSQEHPSTIDPSITNTYALLTFFHKLSEIRYVQLLQHSLPLDSCPSCGHQRHKTLVCTLITLGSQYQILLKLLRHRSWTLLATQLWFSMVFGSGNLDWQQSSDSQHCRPH